MANESIAKIKTLYEQFQQGGTTTGNWGHWGSLNHRRRNRRYPAVSALVKGIHGKRYESNLSHAFQRRSGKPTGPIRWSYFKEGRRLLAATVDELAKKW